MAGKTYRTLQELKFKDGGSWSEGVDVEVNYLSDSDSLAELRSGTDVRKVGISRLYKFLKGYPKPPSIALLQRWEEDGICKTPTGQKVEPDGRAMDGSPSWLLILGMI